MCLQHMVQDLCAVQKGNKAPHVHEVRGGFEVCDDPYAIDHKVVLKWHTSTVLCPQCKGGGKGHRAYDPDYGPQKK